MRAKRDSFSASTSLIVKLVLLVNKNKSLLHAYNYHGIICIPLCNSQPSLLVLTLYRSKPAFFNISVPAVKMVILRLTSVHIHQTAHAPYQPPTEKTPLIPAGSTQRAANLLSLYRRGPGFQGPPLPLRHYRRISGRLNRSPPARLFDARSSCATSKRADSDRGVGQRCRA